MIRPAARCSVRLRPTMTVHVLLALSQQPSHDMAILAHRALEGVSES